MKAIGTKSDGSKVPVILNDIGLLTDRMIYRSTFLYEEGGRTVSFDVDVDRALMDRHGVKYRVEQEEKAFKSAGFVQMDIEPK